MGDNQVELKVWGELALFTRPETKVERVSYEVMTASAARGILESIYWKPQMQYIVDEIHVLNPIQFISIRRNEINKTLALDKMASKKAAIIEIESARTQRNALFLKDVAYIIKAHIVRVGGRHGIDTHKKIFDRRVEIGQYRTQPFFGTRECLVQFAPPDGSEHPINQTKDLGRVMFDWYYLLNGQAVAMFEPLKMQNGIVRFPDRPFNRDLSNAP
jgi:CRISPR-associated protein Cas5d